MDDIIMDSTSDDDEETRFLDAEDNNIVEQEQEFVSDDCSCSKEWDYDVWISSPQSVNERRRRFKKWIEIRLGEFDGEDCINNDTDNDKNCVPMADISRVTESSGAVLRNSSPGVDEFSSFSSRDFDDFDSSKGDVNTNSDKNSNCTVVDMSVEESEETLSNLHHPPQRDTDVNLVTTKKPKKRWLKKLSRMTCIVASSDVKDYNVRLDDNRTRARRVRVQRSRRKRLRELSALFTGQNIEAHKGSIRAMKFSPDGQYLASAGEDKVVRVWKVLEDDRSAEDIPEADPSGVYFSINHRLPDSGPLTLEEINMLNQSRSVRKTHDSACVVFPQKVFRILERPLHEFEGHKGEILDLSWSKNGCLLSSSIDKTVRLWRVGADGCCLEVFLHSDYVTCIQFNPANDDYFISGSIDGKIRVWNVKSCRVVDWVKTGDIISAVSYCPNGEGGVIGTITGTCRFFDFSDNNFKLGAEICFTNKKKSPCKKITGFQFSPQDQTKLLVTCGDSQVRLLHGTNVIQKYKGPRANASSFTSALFASDGKHIVSACEDSNIYIWNYNNDQRLPSRPKSNNSFEFFHSDDALIAISWPGLKTRETEDRNVSRKANASFPLSHESLMDSMSKPSATWPEEGLQRGPGRGLVVSPSSIGKSHYRFFKRCCESSSSGHLWGLVIVTADRNGRIRSFHSYGLPVLS